MTGQVFLFSMVLPLLCAFLNMLPLKWEKIGLVSKILTYAMWAAALFCLLFVQWQLKTLPEARAILHLVNWSNFDHGPFPLTLGTDRLSQTFALMGTAVVGLTFFYAGKFMLDKKALPRLMSLSSLIWFFLFFLLYVQNFLLALFALTGLGLCTYSLASLWKGPGDDNKTGRIILYGKFSDLLLWGALFGYLGHSNDLSMGFFSSSLPSVPGKEGILLITHFLFMGGLFLKFSFLFILPGPLWVTPLFFLTSAIPFFYLMTRNFAVFEGVEFLGQTLVLAGLMVIFLGNLACLTHRNLKKFLLNFSLAQMGYALVGMGYWKKAEALHLIQTHLLLSALMIFLFSALSSQDYDQEDIDFLKGAGEVPPIMAFCAMIIFWCESGLPGGLNFFVKRELLNTVRLSSSVGLWLYGFLILLTMMSTLALLRVSYHSFFIMRKGETRPLRRTTWEISTPLQVLLAVLALFCMGLGWGAPQSREISSSMNIFFIVLENILTLGSCMGLVWLFRTGKEAVWEDLRFQFPGLWRHVAHGFYLEKIVKNLFFIPLVHLTQTTYHVSEKWLYEGAFKGVAKLVYHSSVHFKTRASPYIKGNLVLMILAIFIVLIIIFDAICKI